MVYRRSRLWYNEKCEQMFAFGVSSKITSVIRMVTRKGRRVLSEYKRRYILKVKAGWRHVRRDVLGISKARAAQMCGVSRGTVARWEDSKTNSVPSVVDLATFADRAGYERVNVFGWVAGGKT